MGHNRADEKRIEMDRKGLEKELKEAFCWFHEHPELAYEETRTTAKIREILTRYEIEILPYALETGLVAVIRGEQAGPVQALRCDIDALPIEEETELSYCSREPGKMHACGHDMHITAGIGCAVLLQENRSRLWLPCGPDKSGGDDCHPGRVCDGGGGPVRDYDKGNRMSRRAPG